MNEACAGRAAVIFGNMNVHGVLTTGAYGGGNIFFFNVGMKGIIHHLTVGVIDSLHEANSICSRIEEITLKAVEVLYCQCHITCLSIFRDCMHALDAPSYLIIGGTGPAKQAQCRVERATQKSCPQSLTAIKSPFVEIYTGCPNRGVGANRIILFITNSYCRALKSELINMLPKGSALIDIISEKGDFHPIKACIFKHFEYGVVLFFYIPTPQEKVHTKLHRFSPIK